MHFYLAPAAFSMRKTSFKIETIVSFMQGFSCACYDFQLFHSRCHKSVHVSCLLKCKSRIKSRPWVDWKAIW